jgi:hypothetical protein
MDRTHSANQEEDEGDRSKVMTARGDRSVTYSNPGSPTGDHRPLLTTAGLLMEVRCNEGLGLHISGPRFEV